MDRTKRFAIIDIGSNSIRYLGDGGQKRLITTRLAQGLISSGRLSEQGVERSIAALEEYAALARVQGRTPYAYATSAVRDAQESSRAAFLRRAEEIMPVRVLSGEEEARFALLGAGIGEQADAGLIDLGGGSCQIASHSFAISAPMGCVRAKDVCVENGAACFQSMRDAVFARCNGLFRFPRIRLGRYVGAGGTVTTLSALSLGLEAYDPAAVCRAPLSAAKIEQLARDLLQDGDEKRRAHPLLRERHDVIVPGALVLLYVMGGMGIEAMDVSDADGMEGYLAYIKSLLA